MIVEPQVEPLAGALRDLLSNSEQRTKMGKRARQLTLERFTWEYVAERLEEVYRQALL